MAGRVIADGMKVELREKLSDRDIQLGKTPKTYASRILEITDDEDIISIAMPMEQSRLIPLAKGDTFDAFFYTAKGLYQANILIQERYKDGNIYTLQCEILTELKKYQRRQFFRLVKSIPVKYMSIKDEERDEILKKPEIIDSVMKSYVNSEAISIDVSGGGIRIVGDKLLTKSSSLIVNFNIGTDTGIRYFRLLAKIIKSEELLAKKGKFENRLEFLNITDEDREILIKYIFEEERKLRRNAR